MLQYLPRRLAAALPVLFVVSLLSFGLQAATPGDPAVLLLNASGVTTPTREEIARKHAELHLDDPLPVRYLDWLGNALHGDFGTSFRSGKPVLALYRERFPATLLLTLCAATLSACIAIPLGTLAAYRRGGVVESIAQVVAVIGSAIPGFWVAYVGILVFAVRLHWLPAFGSVTPRGIILPACVLALPNIALLTRLTRAAVLDLLGSDFITVARAKGLSAGDVRTRHVLPNAFLPVLTVLGVEAAHLLTGAAIIETVFAWPGVGKMAVDAALLRDIPVVVGFALSAGLIFLVSNLVVDILAAALDPRVRGA